MWDEESVPDLVGLLRLRLEAAQAAENPSRVLMSALESVLADLEAGRSPLLHSFEPEE
jgi:hypothetical protein